MAFAQQDLFLISMAADMLGMHPQTLRKYERLGLIQPTRTIGSMRLYSREELERLRLIKRLVEVSAAVGRPVRRAAFTPVAASVVYRGQGITVIVTVADGFLGSLTAMAQRRGQPLAGIGDGAWLLNRGRTAVLLVGQLLQTAAV